MCRASLVTDVVISRGGRFSDDRQTRYGDEPEHPISKPAPNRRRQRHFVQPPLNDRPLFQLPEKAIFKAGEPAAGRDSV
jgi:hypothetical protein